MKLNNVRKPLNHLVPMLGLLGALSSSQVIAGDMGPVGCTSCGKPYASIFGGWGKSNKIDVSQYGTAFFFEDLGGPLAVNAFGKTNSRSVGFIGGQVGYQWARFGSLAPAIELEGFYLGKKNFTGHDISNDADRLDEHDFLVKLPMSGGVFLVNAIANFDISEGSRFHPYVGAGLGGAALSISGASAEQVAPPEPGVNHFNANTSDKDTTFAAQFKLGLNTDVTDNFSVFIEYRGLYLGSSAYAFGSTVAPGHAVTSNWDVNLDSQWYNMGAIGLRLSA